MSNYKTSWATRASRSSAFPWTMVPEPVRDFYRQFKMNYPVVMGNAKTGELYGGVLGLPIAFVIGRDGRIYSKHIGAYRRFVVGTRDRSAAASSEIFFGKSVCH